MKVVIYMEAIHIFKLNTRYFGSEMLVGHLLPRLFRRLVYLYIATILAPHARLNP